MYRIACIGGSTTYTSQVDDYTLSYPSLLGELLRAGGADNVEVINAGSASWTTWESLVNFQFRLLDLDPDLIIVYHAINDIHARMVWPPEAYRGDNSGRRGPVGSGIFMPGLAEHSTLLRILMIRAGMTTSHADLEHTVDKGPPSYRGVEFWIQKANGTYPDGIFEEVDARTMLETNRPIYFERNLRNLITLAKDHGVDVVLSSFAYSPHFADQHRFSSEEYQAALEETNQLLATLAEDTKVHFLDFAAVFPKDKRYFTDGRHVNKEGARLKAELFARYLRDNNLPPHN